MSYNLKKLVGLPSPFYRVAAKAVIFDDQNRILMVITKDGNSEVPGGGWEHGETLEECLQREVREELGVGLRNISPIWFTFREKSIRGWWMLRLVVRAELDSQDLRPGDEMKEARFVTKEELLGLNYLDASDGAIKDCVDVIWPV